MEQILDNLEKQCLNFELGEGQRQALLSVFSLLKQPGFQECVVLGRAGTGKTTICQLIIHYIRDYLKADYKLVTPTHKSKRILADKTGEEVTTIHQLLKLKPNIDILDLDWSSLKFCVSTLTDNVPKKGVVIIDECSMINNDLYDMLVNSCKEKECKIIWQGDIKQLAPVKQEKVAKPFLCENIFELSKIYRQQENNPILQILETLRKRPIFDFKPVSSSSGSLILFDSWKAFIRAKIGLFSNAVKDQEPNEVKLLAYTNARVEAFNKVIRFMVFNDPEEYVPGDFLMGYNNTVYSWDRNRYHIDNSNDFRVISAKKEDRFLCNVKIKGWNLELYDYDRDENIEIFVISRDNEESDLDKLASVIEEVRQSAVLCTEPLQKKHYWKEYYAIIESFVLPFDLYHDGKIVKKKAIDYGYAMTVHKSQSSSYDNVLVDMENIWRCTNNMEMRQLQYVAMSRTRNDIYMLI